MAPLPLRANRYTLSSPDREHVVELHDQLALKRAAQGIEALSLVVDDEQAGTRAVQPGEADVRGPGVDLVAVLD